MRSGLSFPLLLAAAALLSGCQASLRPLKSTDPPAAIGAFQPLKRKIPLPVAVNIEAPDSMPSWGGKNTYPVKHYLEKAFRDAGEAAFAQVGAAGDYAYTLEVQALSSQLKDVTPFGSSSGKADFQAELNTVLRDPEGKVVQNKNFSGSAESPSDQVNVPDAVWSVIYRLAGEFLDAVRGAPWVRGALNAVAKSPAAGGAPDLQAMVDAAARKAVDGRKAAEEEPPAIQSDVDKPAYKLSENANNFALVVGVEKYASLPPADFAERDAEAVREHLLALGYPPRNILFLKGSQAVRSGIVKYVESWLPKNVSADSRVFFYFSGHGAPDTKTGQAYLLPWDGDAKFLEETAYPLKRLYEKLNALPAKEVLVAMDSCFSGAGGRSVIPKGARPLVTKVDEGGIPSGKLVVFAAANGDEITGTEASQGHGLFTYYFLKGLGAQGRSGTLTVKSLYDYLAPNVANAARRENRDQTPQLLPASLGALGDLPLR